MARVSALDPRVSPLRVAARDIPHAVIEPNKTCDLRCAPCYSLDRATVKAFPEVVAEIDLALRLRNIETLSIIGGEPTLHPDLPAIVREVKARGRVCQVLTNGLGLLEDDALLDGLVAAGVDRFILHVDAGQSHGDVDAVRHALARRLEGRRAWFCIALTVGPGEEGEPARVLRDLARYRFFDGVLATLALDFERLFDPVRRPARPDPTAAHEALVRGVGARLAAAVPTQVDPDEAAWLMYFYYLAAGTGRTFPLSPRLNAVVRWAWRLATGHHFFAATASPGAFVPVLLATLAAEVALAPSRIGEAWRLLRGSRMTRDLRFQYAVIQVPPGWDEAGRLHVCRHCPDAVVRRGRLLPVCIADLLDPLDGPPRAPAGVAAGIAAHLQGRA